MTPSDEVRLTLQPEGRILTVPAGTALADVLREAEVPFAYPCGGARVCGRCRVEFREGAPSPLPDEERHLSRDEIRRGVRLACCSTLDTDAEIYCAGLEFHTEHILTQGVRTDVVVAPEVTRHCGFLPPSTLETPCCDWDRVLHVLPEEMRATAYPTVEVLRALPSIVSRAERQRQPVTVTMRRNRMILAECGDTLAEHWGVALDVGTTTLSAALINLDDGTEAAHAGCLNPQRVWGDDLISRIRAVQDNPGELEALHHRVIEAANGLIARLCRQRRIEPLHVNAVAVAGNTAMTHLFLRVDPTSLGQAPFAGALRGGVCLEARDLALAVHPHAPVYVLPCIGGFVGGDISAGILVTRLSDQKGVSVLVDIGTNGEVVVARNGEICSTSSAAGPSFEGGKIGAGTLAATGAIHGFTFDGEDLALQTLGRGEPTGICGSGLIEFFARAVETGLLGANGRIPKPGSPEAQALPPRLAARLEVDESGAPQIFLAQGTDGRRLFISQADVREFQLAKGAVQTAICMVLSEMKIALGQIDRFLVAGAFGSHLNIRDAMTIGLLPELDPEKVFFVGNSSMEGARCVLLNPYERQRAEQIASRTRPVELAARSEFQERFALSMFLGPAMEL
jgi:uncharacterized 2Fe-2S/4Fe-4S cluster protein (DUF4445 family)